MADTDRATPLVTVNRLPCESEEERGVDVGRALELTLSSIEGVTVDCASASPLCGGEPDGSRCIYRPVLHEGFVRLEIWPRASDGAAVHVVAFVAEDLSAVTGAARVAATRWAVAGPVRCRGERTQRSYGPPTAGDVTTTTVELTCFHDDEDALALAVSNVALLAPTRREAAARSVAPETLPPGAATTVQVSFEPLRLLLRADNPIEVTLRAGNSILRPVASVTTPERRPVR